MTGLEPLFQAETVAPFDLPEQLSDRYGGSFAVARPLLIANFVATVDGVVAIRSLAHSNQLIADGDDDDRFVMGLLRAVADVIVIGSGTLRASPTSLWGPSGPYPAAESSFAELRRRLHLPALPAVAVVTGSGDLDVSHPALARGAIVLTTDRGAERLRGRLPAACRIASTGDGTAVDLGRAVSLLHGLGHRLILSEAGPRIFGSLVRARLVDELFLTISPLLAGRTGNAPRPGLVDDAELLPDIRVATRLLDLRKGATHLFLRYALDYEDNQRQT